MPFRPRDLVKHGSALLEDVVDVPTSCERSEDGRTGRIKYAENPSSRNAERRSRSVGSMITNARGKTVPAVLSSKLQSLRLIPE